MRANGWGSPDLASGLGQAHLHSAPRAFPLGCPRLKDECLTRIAMRTSQRKRHTKHKITKRRVGMARADSDFGRRARPGERKLPLPKKRGKLNGSFPGI